jgi:outer membrane receptor protein involved in Fe transport
MAKFFKTIAPILYLAVALAPEGAMAQGGASASVPSLDADLDVITVQAERPEWEDILSPGTIDVVIPDDYVGEQKGLAEFLEAVPGLHVNRRGGDGQYTTLTIRGSTAAQVSVYVDGVLQNLAGEAVIDLSIIPVKNVARIEVYRGYVPVRFAGSPIGGVVNIVTKKPEGLGAKVAAGIRSLNGKEGEATVTGPLLSGAFLLGVHHERSDGNFKYRWRNNPLTPGQSAVNDVLMLYGGGDLPNWRRRQSNSHKNTDAMLKWQDDNWYLKAAWKTIDRYYPQATNGGGGHGYTDIGLPSWWVDGSNMTYVPDQPHLVLLGIYAISEHRRQTVDQYEIMFGRRQELGSLEFGIELNYLNTDKKYRLTNLPGWWVDTLYMETTPVGELWSDYKTERYGASADGSLKLGERNLAEFRVDYSYERQRLDANRRGSYEGGGFRIETHEPGYAGWDTHNLLRGMRDSYSRRRIGVQLSDTLTLGDDRSLQITATGRYESVRDSIEDLAEYADLKDNDSYTWSVAVKKRMGEHFTLRLAGGTSSRYPTFYELYGDGVFVKPADLYVTPASWESRPRKEESVQWDIGLDWAGRLLGSDAKLGAAYFHRNTENTIGMAYRRDGSMYYSNSGSTVAEGVEMQVALTWPVFKLTASGTWLDTEYEYQDPDNNGGIASNYPPGYRPLLQPEWEYHVRGDLNLLGGALGLFAEHHFTGEMPDGRGRFTFIEGGMFARTALNVTNAGIRGTFPMGFTLTAGVNDVFDNRPNQSYLHRIRAPADNRDLYYGLQFPVPGRTMYATLEWTY